MTDSKSMSWSGWKSPIGLGFFLLTGSLALAIFLYTVINLFVSIEQSMHPVDQGMSAQELQQMEQQETAPTSAAGATGTTGQ